MSSHRRRSWGLAAAVLALALGLSAPVLAARQPQAPATGQALLRMVQVSPNTPRSAVFLNDDQTFCSLGFGGATRYVSVNPGTYAIRVVEVPETAGPSAGVTPAAPAASVTPRAPTAVPPTATAAPRAPTAAPPAATVAPRGPTAGPPAGVTPGVPPAGVTPQGPAVSPPAGVTPGVPPREPGSGPPEGAPGGPRADGSDVLTEPNTDPQAQATPSAARAVAAGSADLVANTAYSGVLVGMTDSAEIMVLQDDLSAPPAGQVRVRFANASPNAPALDLRAGDNTLFSGVAYKQASDYAVTAPATEDLQLRQAGTDNVLATLPGASLTGGVVYTIYAAGVTNGQPALRVLLTVESVGGMAVPAG